MNGNNSNNSSMGNQNQIPKNLPLKKRRTYLDASTMDAKNPNSNQQENYSSYRSTISKPTNLQDDPLQVHIPSAVMSTPPPSLPHIELLRQHYAYAMANTLHSQHDSRFSPSPSFECLMTQKALMQQCLDSYRLLFEQQYQNSQYGYQLVDDKKDPAQLTIDEHFRKSLGDNYHQITAGFLTPEDSSSNSSPTERSPVDSIEEHFARSLGKLWPITTSSGDNKKSSMTESDVDDHFAKALGATTWERLKEKS